MLFKVLSHHPSKGKSYDTLQLDLAKFARCTAPAETVLAGAKCSLALSIRPAVMDAAAANGVQWLGPGVGFGWEAAGWGRVWSWGWV